jgi:Mn-dependent DtxR family transcriptional regulator
VSTRNAEQVPAFRILPHRPSVFDEISPAEIELLRELAQKGAPVSEARLNADALRSLGLRRYIKRLSGFSIITPDGRKALQSLDKGQTPAPAPAVRRDPYPYAPQAAAPEPEPESDETRVNTTQEDMLRQLALAEAPVPFDDLDGRVVRALEGRGLVTKSGGLVLLTDAGRTFYESKVRRRRRARSGWVKAQPVPTEHTEDRQSRAQSIREAVDALQRCVGDMDRLEIGDLDASAQEAFTALLELAERIERGADPRRITRG